MNLFRTTLAAAAAVLVFAAAGCSDSADSGSDSGSGSGAQDATTEAPLPTGAPSTEASGPESPRTADDTGGAITIPQLPIGGVPENPGAEEQCVTASWLQPDLLPDNGVEVTGLQLEPPGAFRLGGRCGESPACASFTFSAAAGTCSVAVTARGTGGDATLTIKGQVVCAAGKDASCRDLPTRVSPGQIGLTQPESPSTETTATPTG
ncbi:hypothetical protein [Amycolatopsis sp. NBC_01286]|uniref:hypothetical protein n=1 Tax=Amycolatopsis sp. NBC_01286 TaxID=2903560 RepID=UPI002E0FE13C|nr:hypothetical protein OG570_30335 [Amycolatopsis sp. NBC_01286]